MDDKLNVAAAAADSQFLPDTTLQYAWDSVSLTSILACPRRYQFSIVEGYVSKSTGYAIALSFGILFHKGLELYHIARAKGQAHDEALHSTVWQLSRYPGVEHLPVDEDIDELKAAHDPDEDDGINLRNSKVRTRYYLFRAVVWYCEHYADDPVETLLLASGTPAVELSFRIPLDLPGLNHPILLCGHIDRAVRFNDYLYVSDYKTTKSLTSQFFGMFDLSHQLTGYTTAGQVIFDQPVKGAMVDGVALQVGQAKFARGFTNRTPGQTSEYMQLLLFANQQALRFFESGQYPMNTSACYFCDYREICRQPPEYRDRYLNMHFEKKRGWNPLENR